MKEQADRVLSLVRQRRIPVAPCLTEAEVAQFEQEQGIFQPPGYRWFLLAVGGCCPGPPNGGLLPPDTLANHWPVPASRWPSQPSMSEPFPFTEKEVWEDDGPPEEELYCGSLYLGSDGCIQGYHLAVSGPQAGNVWDITQFGAYPCNPPLTFLDWFERWATDVSDARVMYLRERKAPGPLWGPLRRRGWVLRDHGTAPDQPHD